MQADLALAMLPSGYRLAKSLHETRRTALYRAVREADGREVLLKVHRGADGRRWAERELDVLRRAAGPGVVAVLGSHLDEGGPPVVVLEAASGPSLASFSAQPLELRAFVGVATALADTLARVHEAHIVHKDVQPSNVVVDPATLEIWIVDFGSAAELGAADLSSELPRGSLPYVAPEQTGRINHGVDFRSDLYALGATFHHLLAGCPPFDGSNCDLIHAHLALSPPSLTLLRPELPAVIARIVEKLMRKQPEERYQSARALCADLRECAAQLERTGDIPKFPLGRGDVPSRPSFARTLRGREREREQLREAFARASAGEECSSVWLRGLPGMGKTALVDELRTLVAERGGYLACGKFDLYRREVAYSGVRAAIEALAQQWLTEDDTRVARWGEALRAELGAIARVLAEWVPDLEILLGPELPQAPALGSSETRARLSLAVQRLVRVAASESPPLVLVLDDLQCADAASLQLLEDLLAHRAASALLVVGIYRSSDVDAAHPLHALLGRLRQGELPLCELEIGPISTAATAELLAEALGRRPEDTRKLAERIAIKTGNSPLLIQQFVLHMHALGFIRFARDCWVWDDRAIVAADVPDGAVGLMIAKIERLPAQAREVLQLASCLAYEFSSDLLRELSARDRPELEAGLWVLSQEGLIAPSRSGFRFAHDRIREAAQELLDGRERQRIHAEAARLLLERTPEAELASRVMEIADHLNVAAERLDEAGRVRALELNAQAGNRALRFGAPATARCYFAAGQALLHDSDWSERPQLAFDLLLRHADAVYQLREYDRVLELIQQLERRELPVLEQAQVAAHRISLEVTRLSQPEVVALVLATLRRFGVSWPERPSLLRVVLALLWTDWKLRGSLSYDVFVPADPRSLARWLPPLIVMRAASPTLAMTGQRLVGLFVAHSLRVYRRHGYVGSVAPALAGYAGAHQIFLPFPKRARRYAEAAVQWCARTANPALRLRAEVVLERTIHTRTRPRRASLEPLRRMADAAREVGDVEFVAFALTLRVEHAALVGEPLQRVAQHVAELKAFGPSLSGTSCIERSLALLIDGHEPPLPGDAVSAPGWKATTTRMQRPMTPFWFGTLCMIGAYERAFSAFDTLQLVDDPRDPDYALFRGLAAAELARSQSGSRGHRRELARCARRLRAAARSGRDFVHMALLLSAERAGLRRRDARTLQLYAAAEEAALKQGYRHHAALILERRAQLLIELRRETEAAGVLQRALALYDEWGARAKARMLGEQLRRL